MAEIDIPFLVRKIRRSMNMTQEQFAHHLGVTYSTINQWENGHRRPQPFLVRRLFELEASTKKKGGIKR